MATASSLLWFRYGSSLLPLSPSFPQPRRFTLALHTCSSQPMVFPIHSASTSAWSSLPLPLHLLPSVSGLSSHLPSASWTLSLRNLSWISHPLRFLAACQYSAHSAPSAHTSVCGFKVWLFLLSDHALCSLPAGQYSAGSAPSARLLVCGSQVWHFPASSWSPPISAMAFSLVFLNHRSQPLVFLIHSASTSAWSSLFLPYTHCLQNGITHPLCPLPVGHSPYAT